MRMVNNDWFLCLNAPSAENLVFELKFVISTKIYFYVAGINLRSVKIIGIKKMKKQCIKNNHYKK